MAELNTLEDFLENDRFREWIRFPDGKNRVYWEQWLEKHPLKRPLFETAVAAMASLEGSSPEISDAYIHHKIARIKARFIVPEPIGRTTNHWQTQIIQWAAVLVLVAGLGWLLLNKNALFQDRTKAFDPSVETLKDPVKSFVNSESQPLLVNLPDGSSVVLSSGSKLEYDAPDGIFSREVRLIGEGFFEVAKDAAHPFFVYTTRLTTRVLGTSFLVRSFDNEPKATVTVRTGKVSVTSKKDEKNHPGTEEETLLLNPNEQVSLVVATEEMIRETLDHAVQDSLPELLQHPRYEFHLTPVSDVFALLEKAYGAPIKYDAERFEHCTLTATLSDEPFLDKIRMICIGIEADFEVSDDQIIITGNGCDTR